ncbi:MAG TPA: CapA family protein [Gemmatimonadales bacterium]|nr:CapA family protein [Gemmatimonadales bacterium]
MDSTLPAGPDPRTVRFNGTTAHLDAIASAGFDVAQTANSRTDDRGPSGMLRTLHAVQSRSMRPVGTAPSRDSLAAAPVLVDVNGVRLAFPAYTIAPNVYLSADSRPEWPLRELPIDALGFQHLAESGARSRAGALSAARGPGARRRGAARNRVGALGREYYLAPSEDQRRAAHDIVDAGFDLVVGSHSHVLVPAEVYRGKLSPIRWGISCLEP